MLSPATTTTASAVALIDEIKSAEATLAAESALPEVVNG